MQKGFSLVELSIVLVILGLLTGGILAGQNLIRASELRSVSAQLKGYQSAVYTFRDKYFALPGDFRDATKFWGRMVSAGHCVTNSSAAVAAPGSCDGDGDGVLDDTAANQAGEEFTFWQMLANAGLIEGSYTGLAGSGGGNHSVIGVNSPRSKITNGGFGVDYANHPTGNVSDFPHQAHRFWIGAQTSGNHPNETLLVPEEAWNLDTKLDDGRPGLGKMQAWRFTNCTTTNSALSPAADAAQAEYKLTDSSIGCALMFFF